MVHIAWGLFAALALMLMAGVASAQSAGTTQLTQPYIDATKSSDMSTQAFTALLGTFFTNPFSAIGTASTLLGSMFLVFNTFILVAGTIWATYGIGVAIVQTAHEGQLMGKKLSQVWLPIRMVTGVASLIPAFGGFSLSQAVLVFATTLGIGAANLGYNAMIDGTNNLTTVVAPSFVTPKGQGAASLEQATFDLFRSHVCMLAQNAYVEAHEREGLNMTAERVSRINGASGSMAAVSYGKPGSPTYCGGVGVDATNVTSEGRSASSIGGYRVASVNYDGIAQAMQQRAASNFSSYASQVESLASNWYANFVASQNGGPTATLPRLQLEGIAANYYAGIQAAAGNQQQQSQALNSSAIESMRKYGWFGAGAWYATLAEVNAAMAQAAQSVNFRAFPMLVNSTGNNTKLNEALNGLIASTEKAESAPENAQAKGNSSGPQALCALLSSSLADATTTPTGNCSFGQSFAMKLIDLSTSGAGGATASSASGLRLIDPIIAMKNMGDYLMVAAESGFVIYSYVKQYRPTDDEDDGKSGGVMSTAKSVAGTVLSKVAKFTPMSGLVSAFESLMAILPTLLGAMFILGAVMSLWLPMVPFVNWWGGLVQYLTIFFEGIAAGPIWAFVHLDANGEGMGQRTETGYLFIINMLFRPFLMLLGFVAAAALMIVMGSFLFWIYPSVMGNVQGNSVTGVASIIGFLVIFWVLMHTLVTTLSNMSVLLPDQALAWAGKAIGATLGRDADQQTRGTFMAFGRFGQQGMGEVAKGAQQLRAANAKAKAEGGGSTARPGVSE
ncbi:MULTISPECIES: DotA/TraY family protein [unclassified Variovorax]|uniref:DotA/TraY family protein n=1 Tax=unclassified Variovorax TaxID=663243 RepID=UPI00076C5F76|nr:MULTISPECIES: DotA/TraY family protein [unclassified Variovorax]KWT65020.1 defect in organelle trafficking protein DotA [Variovorax sp. WDL1]